MALGSCSLGADQRLATEDVARFHSRYNDEHSELIYLNADPAFRQATSQAEFEKLLATVHQRLGAWESSVNEGWNVSESFSGTQVRLKFKTEYALGEATEQFVYRIVSGKAYLVGFNFNSPLLITK